MEIDLKVVSDVPSSSGLSITLHPLVIMNVSEHYTRTKVQLQASSTIGDFRIYMFGALLGSQNGREIELHNSFELPFDEINGQYAINRTYFTTKQEQFRQVFPKLDFLGWYSTGPFPTSSEIHVHQQMLEFNEAPLFLQLNPISSISSKDLPIEIYESTFDILDGYTQMMFLKSSYKIETGEAERIAVDHVAHTISADASQESSRIFLTE
ncbi:COP9 signalosome complex subunit 6 [Nowakowskiella sp. JEL0078]|nr:COP9 signalosome complex subunit 6 [Nowakowskiella sp. JEL0078]